METVRRLGPSCLVLFGLVLGFVLASCHNHHDHNIAVAGDEDSSDDDSSEVIGEPGREFVIRQHDARGDLMETWNTDQPIVTTSTTPYKIKFKDADQGDAEMILIFASGSVTIETQ